jgi:hypothetical protein
VTGRSYGLPSALLRMLAVGDDPRFQKADVIDHVSTSMGAATPEEKSCYSAEWMDAWSTLEIITASPSSD